ncbi:sensor domain-containing diguanylate cyclase [Paenibacillus cremeus]|uniref:Sensor domain-containing diguanylate cyclase n=1 Tax=Paenibacillus cremeus TaxID=2163881 RepID=A0A559KF60_9BACL|nr:sensor domain-containing diguanylate cyclase [Paenibacillus cremeus]TVY10763.1 sensor domain-containing diguanylate cyclase [Paenibacillus cremeus]
MRKKAGFKLRTMAGFLVVVSVMTTLCICAFIGYRNEKESLIRMTFQLNQMYSDKMAETADGLFATMKTSLQVTGEYLAKDLTRPDMFDQLEQFRLNHSTFNSIILVDKDNVFLETSPGNLGLKGTKVSTEGALNALKVRRPVVTEPYMSATNYLVVLIIQPLFDAHGNYLGAFGGTIRLHEDNALKTMLGNKTIRENGSYVYVVSSAGNVLYHPISDRIGEHAPQNPVVSEVMQGKSGTMRLVNTRGVDFLASYSIIKETGWGVVSQTPTSVVLAASRELVKHLVLYVMPMLVALLLVIYWFIGKMSEPLAKLAQYATSMLSSSRSLQGEMPAIQTWNFEANALHQAFGMAVRHLRHQFDHLSQEAQTDPLTGLYNRRTMGLYIDNWMRKRIPFALLILDLDNFKRVNDTFGHEKGDEVLTFLSRAMLAHVGQGGVCYRFGGEEFVILLPDTGLATACRYAETIRQFMAETNSPIGQPVTLSIGAAAYPDSAKEAEQLFRLADEALYRAKRQGKNRVELAQAAQTIQ